MKSGLPPVKPKPRLALLTRYAQLGASSRVRAFQFSPDLRQAGFEVDEHPLLGDDYVRDLYLGRRSAMAVLASYARRLGSRHDWGRADIVWVEKELFPYIPAVLELSMLDGCRLVLDFDDAIFHNYDLSARASVRRLLGDKIDRLMRRADLVTVGNGYLANRALDAGARRVEVLPSVVDLRRYPRPVAGAQPRPDSAPFVIVWIGSPATSHYLELVRPALEQLAQRHAIRLDVIGADAPAWSGVAAVGHTWSADTEAELIAGADVGIMPLADSPWEQGKCSFKLIQYMACGLPVVASPVGMNREVVREGINGLLAHDQAGWVAAIERLITDQALRRQWGAAGRADVEARFNLEVVGARMAALFSSLLEHR